MASGEVVAAYGWNASVALLRKEGVDVALMKPKEGIITWTDGLLVFKDHPGSEDLAYEFIDAYMSPQSGAFVIDFMATAVATGRLMTWSVRRD